MRHRNNESDEIGRPGRGHPRGRHSEENAGVHRHGRHHGHHGGHSHRGRFFDHGDLRLVALQLIAEKPRHGYEIIKAIEEKSGGAYIPSPGAVYPTLTLLEELGQLTVKEADDGRKLHTLTEQGAAALVANRKTVDAVFARMAQAGAGSSSEPLIENAFRELRHSLRLRLARGDVDEAQAKDIVSALDAARDAIANGSDS